MADKTFLKSKLAIALFLVLLAFSTTAQAKIIYVDDDGPADFDNIQAAIDDSNDGDIISVADGTYNGQGNRDVDFLGKAISVRSENGPENCIIDCQSAGRGFHFQSGEDENSIVQGFTITNGIAPEGGAIYCSQSSPKLINCVFRANEGTNDDSGGGAIYNDYSSPTVINCTFIENEAYPSAAFGGAVHNNTSSPTLTNCTFLSNKAWSGGAIFNNNNSNPILTNCTFTTNTASRAGAIGSVNSSPMLVDCNFTRNSAFYGGGMSNLQGDTMVINCRFAGNFASIGGGAVWNSGYVCYVNFVNCMFSGNLKDGDSGGGIESNSAIQTLLNCTFSENTGAIDIYDDSVLNMQNCIVANDRGLLYFESGNVVEIDYCCIPDWVIQQYGGTGNFDADPLLVDPDGDDDILGTEDDNLRLLPDSPCIDAGDPNYVPGPNETDLDGMPRVIAGRIDMGAFEYQPRIIYVDDDASGANDGSSWDDAYNYLQDALADANSSTVPVEIRVAQGTYKPDQGGGNTSGDREATFQLINGVTLKGGYAGSGQPDPNARDIELYVTILTGDLAGDDEPNFANNGDNSYQVVTATNTDETTVLDGLTITAGNANHPHYLSMKISGGGMYMLYSSPTIIDCIFTSNSAAYGGAGLSNYKGNPILTNCTFHNNLATSHPHYGGSGVGAGMRNSTGSPILTKCIFSNNHAKGRYPGDFGGVSGGLHCYVETSNDLDKGPTLIDCIFTDNTAQSAAGGMCPGIGNTILINCIFTRNYAESGGAMASAPRMMVNCLLFENSAEYGGAMYFCEDKNNLIINCTFVANSATFVGGILDCEDSIANLTNCILFNNTSSGVADEQAQIYLPDGTPVLNYNCIQGWTGDLGGNGNIGSDPLFVDPINNDYHLLTSSPCIDSGDPNDTAEPNETDLDGRPRIINGRIDMGAYEYDSTMIMALVDINPGTLNLKSKGKWITAYIWLPDDYEVANIDPNSILLGDEIKPEKFWLTEDNQIAIAKFSREEVQSILDIGEIELTITGRLNDGTLFEAKDKIKVIERGGKK